jgi:glycosyltransferase involved in cell wall biosynthesis
LKGFPVYQQLDSLIADGTVKNAEFWIIGRWPKDIHWKKARTFPPVSGKKLGDLLRQCHVYITASLWEPCGMHHVEGAQCGLPLLSHVNGGGIVEAAEKYGILFDNNLPEAIEQMRLNYPAFRKKVLLNMPGGARMSADYVRIIQYVLAQD